MIPFIVTRNSHDRTGPVAHQHEVRDPDRNMFSAERIYRIHTQWQAVLFHRFKVDLADTSGSALFEKICYRCVPFGRFTRQWVVSCYRHESDAEKGVRPGGKNPQRIPPVSECKIYFQTHRSADPISLHGLYRIGPAV